ncbi:2OG-Fe(II) oxygenase [Spirosoma sp. KCTC 42546]|uniref:2OG-Fe(II) oxygenase n=1 Tax=Spirosoma sp. KCTC 42546 TaxID=2520506 RepID=UPI00115B6932|nr:2OG-Fe(II) oxygenase [Spirosoma sp. KCTC 42546]QDK83070.1 2OG-Fe(II) oxygenase [Spirosoma sp. KCTC 42546]
MNPLFEPIIDGIVTHGYGIVDDFLSLGEVKALANRLHERHIAGQFRAAGIGNQQILVENAIRGDEILWIDEATATPDETAFLQLIGEFVQYANQTCYLGLREFEFHYARYPAGTFYKRHLDQFRSDSRRKLSVICYLNIDWKETDGGQLALYLPDSDSNSERQLTIAPTAGRLVCFESGRLEHEVLPATRERLSITGWLKTG